MPFSANRNKIGSSKLYIIPTCFFEVGWDSRGFSFLARELSSRCRLGFWRVCVAWAETKGWRVVVGYRGTLVSGWRVLVRRIIDFLHFLPKSRYIPGCWVVVSDCRFAES